MTPNFSNFPAIPDCGGSFNQTALAFKSPYYPRDYPNGLNCTWVMSAPKSSHVARLYFVDFHLESNRDFLTVRDGSSASSPMLGRYTGDTVPTFVSSTGPSLFVQMTTDGSGVDRGFIARFHAGKSHTNLQTMSFLLIAMSSIG